MKSNIKCVILDCGGVIITDGFKRAVPALSKKLGASEEDIFKAYIATISPNYVRGLMKPEARWHAFFAQLGVSFPLKEFLGIVNTIYQPIKGAIELVPKLKQQGYKVGILANQSEETLNYLKEKYPPLFKVFDFYLWSCEHGMSKPDHRFFEKAIAAAQVPADQCLYVDDQDKFLEKAKGLGLHTLKFQSPEQFKQALTQGNILAEEKQDLGKEREKYKFVKKG